MAEEPQLPAVPSITDDWDRKKRFVEKKHSIIKCGECKENYSPFIQTWRFCFQEINR